MEYNYSVFIYLPPHKEYVVTASLFPASIRS